MVVLMRIAGPPRIGCEVLVALSPAGPLSTVLTIIGSLNAVFSSTCTVQVIITVDPMGRTGLGVLLDSVTEVGVGTA